MKKLSSINESFADVMARNKKGAIRKEDVVQIESWCEEYLFKGYTINQITNEISGGIYVNYSCTEIPDFIKWGNIKELNFSGCKNLISLKNCPTKVSGNFNCYGCDKLTSLEGCPQEVGGNFCCEECNKLTSLKGAPQKVGGYFSCKCTNITSLEGAPKEVGGNFFCSECAKKFTKEEVRKNCNVKKHIYVV